MNDLGIPGSIVLLTDSPANNKQCGKAERSFVLEFDRPLRDS